MKQAPFGIDATYKRNERTRLQRASSGKLSGLAA